ncbi:Peroxisomal membrane protein 11A [Auxenochlorella protothecoides]|uniref:Peroxisomal membrane protein 11A n=1 Tax=Auxenochlorella protothecoides TaxID=3075 RepID=A0A087SIQ0_AUXPR|nr:Peroxisomal membrane protein 11A [Auxenochlorella protothecoides]KFM25604.1 Peroxisomal membrane protein 11A [Auxenochlorella protothecoides]RMZ52493.1 hypothetical protein APUTEX25_003636 [Auxenochlorella protothecoides]|eukprot:RMZ52493.1 hypothetical protein APUTEX25_003636 [Auxenochlorella protothecoides]
MSLTLNNATDFLAKRDGIDKTLKVIRYTSRLLLAGSLPRYAPELGAQLKALEGSLGTTRKALKLGKFLGGVKNLRSITPRTSHAALKLVAGVGDTVYLFMEQLQWMIKVGLLSKRHADSLSYVSAWFELVGYCGSITLATLLQQESLELELKILDDLARSRQTDESWGPQDEHKVQARLSELRAVRTLRTLSILQDAADSFLALADIQKSGKLLQNPALQAAAGLLSAVISGYTKWPGVKP